MGRDGALGPSYVVVGDHHRLEEVSTNRDPDRGRADPTSTDE